MVKEILVNVGINEIRVALIEDGTLVEFSIESSDEQRRAGNIYRGRVKNVLPGMQAAFIDIGEEKNAFLYKDDVIPKDIESDSLEELKNLSITDLLREDQEILVQMIKEPIGTKGARVVTQITLPGRYLVLIPSVDYVGVSRRIEDEGERERLKNLVSKFKTPGIGLIIRTAAQEVELPELQNDYEFLLNVWKKIQKKAKKGSCPSLVYRDHDLLYRVLRDYLSKDIHRLLIDENEAYLKALELVQSLAPSLKNKIQHYNEKIALFDAFNIESQLEKAMRRKVWLDSGAYLVFDQTEALSVIDVNTGKFTGSVSLEDTVFQTNLSAVSEIARQIRLRNLAGIIIIDFIDMVSDAERAQVIEQLKAQFERDKIKANILGFTSLGLLELTRKKVKQSLREILQTECEHCEGSGYKVSLDNLAHRAVRAIQQIAQRTPEPALLLGVNPQVGSLLIGPGGVNLEKTEKNLNKVIFIKGQDYLSLDQVRLLASGDKDEIEMLAFPVREGSEIDLRILEAHMSNPNDGIARLEGYIINVEGAGVYIGKKIRVVITKTYRTYARARLAD
ncbi:MAG: Rne/Rng family ribonuclease [Firmicutes bacterium]|nr:Rne/Rng family ribonuclease [Bacillota bacterium]